MTETPQNLLDVPAVVDLERSNHVRCAQCKKRFVLRWRNEYYDPAVTLVIRGCPSGGIYDVLLRCPHCDYEEDL